MPAYAAVTVSSGAERAASTAILKLVQDGAPHLAYAEVLRVEDAAGLAPSKAFVSIRNLSAADEAAPNVTLNTDGALAPGALKLGTRGVILCSGETLFAGSLVRRRELGRDERLLLEFWDDRWLLSKIPVRGALVWDPIDAAIKFAPRYFCRPNAGGYRNCTLVPDGGSGAGRIPVFTAYAELGTQGAESDLSSEDAPAPGVATYWTPKRMLQYLRYVATIYDPPAFYAADFACLDSSRVLWPAAEFNPGVLDRKLPEIDFQGQTLLGALQKTLDVSGDYGLRLEPLASGQNVLSYYARTSETSGDARGVALTLQRSGAATDCRTAFDFSAESDASATVAGVLVEGGVARIESEFEYANSGGDTLVPAWSADEESAFKGLISAATNKAYALRQARQNYPKVFRAFRIPGDAADVLTKLAGHGAVFQDAPTLKVARTPGAVQLEAQSESSGERRGLLRVPVRIQVSENGGSSDFHDVTANSGFRASADGLIWFDGLTDDLAGADNLYTGSLSYDPDHAALKRVRLNCALPHDVRVRSARDIFSSSLDPNAIAGELDATLAANSLQHYIDAPDAFREEHQVASKPALVFDGAPRERVRQTDAAQLAAHAERRLRDKARVARRSVWRLIGIRPEFRAGLYLREVRLVGGTLDAFPVRAPLARVIYDFERQETIVEPE